jgi:hypothetical protein
MVVYVSQTEIYLFLEPFKKELAGFIIKTDAQAVNYLSGFFGVSLAMFQMAFPLASQ